MQVNIAPYGRPTGEFVGAAMNTVTKSGTTTFFGDLAMHAQPEQSARTQEPKRTSRNIRL